MKNVVNLLCWGKAQEHAFCKGRHHCDLFRGGWSTLHVTEVFVRVFAESDDLCPFLIGHLVTSVKGACAVRTASGKQERPYLVNSPGWPDSRPPSTSGDSKGSSVPRQQPLRAIDCGKSHTFLVITAIYTPTHLPRRELLSGP